MTIKKACLLSSATHISHDDVSGSFAEVFWRIIKSSSIAITEHLAEMTGASKMSMAITNSSPVSRRSTNFDASFDVSWSVFPIHQTDFQGFWDCRDWFWTKNWNSLFFLLTFIHPSIPPCANQLVTNAVMIRDSWIWPRSCFSHRLAILLENHTCYLDPRRWVVDTVNLYS